MTDREINIAIAEAVGWEKYPTLDLWHKQGELSVPTNELPDYCNDLNAMHEAEKALDDPGDFVRYAEELCKIASNRKTDGPTYFSIHTTARQRAEAFLRTLGKWEES